jgi:hypothetical protein
VCEGAVGAECEGAAETLVCEGVPGLAVCKSTRQCPNQEETHGIHGLF